jgi:sugar lactone lactonase YvrE
MPFVNLRLAILLFCLGAGLAPAQQYVITTVAGGRAPATPLNGVSPVGIYYGSGVTTDSQGNVYFSDRSCCVWKLDHNGVVTRVAGQWNQQGYAGDGGPAVSATLNTPGNLAADRAGNLYLVDMGNGVIRQIAPDGSIAKLVDAAAQIPFGLTPSVAVDPAGSLYYANCDPAHYSKGRCSQTVVHKIALDGTITAVAGGGTGTPGDGGPAANAHFNAVSALAVDAQGDLYIAVSSSEIIENSNVVIKVLPDGSNILVAGNGSPFGAGSGDGEPATQVPLSGVTSMAIDGAGNLYLAMLGLRKISPDGIITTVGGVSAAMSLAADSEGSLLIINSGVLSQLSPGGTLTTILSANPTYGDGGPASLAQMSTGVLAADPAGNLYLGGRKITPDGTITTIAGGGSNPPSNGMLATQAQFGSIGGEVADAQGNLYISDLYLNRVYKVASTGILTVIAGGGNEAAPSGGNAVNTALYSPSGLALDSAGNLYIANNGYGVIQKVTPDGSITTLAGTGFPCCGELGDGGPALQAQVSNPKGVAVDANGNIYILDGDATIRKVTPDGIIHTVVSWDSQVTNPDGTTATADVYAQGLALDAAGNLFFTSYDNMVRELKTDGTILNIAGNGTAGYSGDGGPALAAQFNLPLGLAVDANGRVYVGDAGNQAVRVLIPRATAPLLALSMTHSGSVSPGQASVNWVLIVSNTAGGAATSGTVSVTDLLPVGLTLGSMGGPGWSCSGATCTRSDALGAGASYPPVTVTANTRGYWPGQAMNTAAVSGGGSVMSVSAQDFITLPACGVTLTSAGQVVPASGGTFNLGVFAASTCSWTVSADQSWVMYFVHNPYGSVFPSGPPFGDGQIAFTSQQNNGPARTAYLTIGDQVFRILQEATPPTGLQAIGSLAHFTSGGGWSSALTLVNPSDTAATARLDFFDNNGSRLQLPWTFPESFFPQGPIFAGSLDRILNPYALTVLDIQRDSVTDELPGSALFSTDGSASGSIVFEYRPTGQQAVVPLETRNAPSYVLAFDNTGELQTGVAISNASALDATLSVIVRDETGRQLAIHSESLYAWGHASFMLTKYTETAGIRGTMEVFTPTGGRISMLGLRVNHGIAITTLPVSATGSAGGGTLAQVAVQGGWQTTFTLVNTGATAATATLKLFDDSGAPLALPLTSPSSGALGTVSSLTLPLAAGASVVIETQGDDAAAEVTGSAQLSVAGGSVSDFAIFRYNPTQQEAAVPPAASAASSNVLVFDNTNGLVTGIAVANPDAQPLSLAVTARDQTGAVLGTGTMQLPAFGHRQFMLSDAQNGGFAKTQNLRGTVEFTTPGGAGLAVLGIRATAAGVITSIPVVAK